MEGTQERFLPAVFTWTRKATTKETEQTAGFSYVLLIFASSPPPQTHFDVVGLASADKVCPSRS